MPPDSWEPDEPFADEAARPDEATVPDDEPLTDEMTVPADEALESDAAGAAATELPFEAEPADDDALENEEAPMAESVPAPADEDALPADEYAAPLPDERYSEEHTFAVADELSESAAETPSSETSGESESDEDEADGYYPIVLVPAEPYPPTETASAVPPTADEPATDQAVVNQPAATADETAVAAPRSFAEEFGSLVLPNLHVLESGRYYIQIAVLRDRQNIRDVLTEYGKNYPIVLVPLASGAAVQVMVGPVTVDEYETVMNRFVSYGFTDAFLRKIR